MSEFKGTKGKWEVYTPDHMGSTNVKFGRDVWDGFVEIWHHQLGKEEAKANAQLISKAPEMLELLKDMYDDYECFSDISSNGFGKRLEQLIKEATTI